MKLTHIILSALSAAALLCSCNNNEWAPGKTSNYSGVNVYFVQPEQTYYSLPIDTESITFNIERDDAPYEDEYVPVKLICSHPEAFEAVEPAFFWAGELTATVTVRFSSRMQSFKDYSFSLVIDEDYTQQYLSQTSYPRIDVTVVKEDFEVIATNCRYTCGGVLLGVIDWDSQNRQGVELEYSLLSDTYRFDPWGHGTYITFSVDENYDLTLDQTSYRTGEYFTSGGTDYMVTASRTGDCYFAARAQTYYFTFDYGFDGQSVGQNVDQLLVR